MQCHVEMTPQLIAAWCADWDKEAQVLAQPAPSVQTPEDMLLDVAEKTAMLHCVADGIYAQWIRGLAG